MGLVGAGLAVVDPLLNGALILLPGVVTRERLDRGDVVPFVEELVFLFEQGQALLGGFVFVADFVALGQEGLLLYDRLVLGDDVRVACRQSLRKSGLI